MTQLFKCSKGLLGRFLLPTIIGTELEGKNAFTLQLERLHFDINRNGKTKNYDDNAY